MTNPCERCAKRQGCTQRCFAKKDYDKGRRKYGTRQ